MGSHETQNQTPPAAEQHQAAGRDRGAIRAVDLTEEEIAAIEASEMTPGYEHLDAELEPKPTSLVEEGVRSARELGHRGEKTEGRPVDKAFRDSLYEER